MSCLWLILRGLTVGFILLMYSVVSTVKSVSLFHLFFIYLAMYVLGYDTSII